MSTSTISRETEAAVEAVTRAQAVWLTAVQIAALALLALALAWAGAESNYFDNIVPAPSLEAGKALVFPSKLLLLVLAAGHLLIAVVPALRRGPLAGIWGGVTLATVCWFAARVTFLVFDKEMELYDDSGQPIIAALVPAAALVLAVWGLIVRAKLPDASRLGTAALAGAIVLALFGAGFYLLINYSPAFRDLYSYDMKQFDVLLSSIALYPAALWLGSTGLRPAGGWRFQPLGMALIIGIFFVCWKIG
ncbi:MAG: hypothetical protein ACYC6A_26410 [Armatimonadota bacterium]